VHEYQPPVIADYPFHDRTIRVTQCGSICIGHRKINLSTVFAGQYVGIREVADQVWLVSFMHRVAERWGRVPFRMIASELPFLSGKLYSCFRPKGDL